MLSSYLACTFQRSCDDTRSLQAECQNTKQCQLLDPNLANTVCLRVAELQLPFTSLKAIKRYQKMKEIVISRKKSDIPLIASASWLASRADFDND